MRYITPWILLVSFATLLASCGGGGGGDPEPTPPSAQDAVRTKLTSATWTVQSVTVDGVDQSGLYKNLSLKFTASTYTATNGGVIWPASGTWSFTDQTATAIKKEDGTEVIIEVTDTSLKLTLTWLKTTLGPGRLASMKGVHVFTCKK
ncbi:MAG TPA: hypothetical protein VFE50_21830 [Cyclobacteriaceae bacterium]|nr:hypothetical protein [Cyclobacteriaceae bacterium]